MLAEETRYNIGRIHTNVEELHSNLEIVDANIEVAHSAMKKMHSGIDRYHQDAESAKIIEWLSTLNFFAQHADLMHSRQEGTGLWFLEAPEFMEWRDQPGQTLVCTGIAGCGKTMIVAAAIEHLLVRCESNADTATTWLYCSYKARNEQSTTMLLSAILKQLLQSHSKLIVPARILYQQHSQKETKPTADEICNALETVLASLSTVHVVIDALDELSNEDSTRQHMIERLRLLQKKSDLRLLFTTRPMPDIIENFVAGESLSMTIRAHEEDIRNFIAGQISRLPNCIKRDPSLQYTVQTRIASAIDGM